jgi:hypothetical protein
MRAHAAGGARDVDRGTSNPFLDATEAAEDGDDILLTQTPNSDLPRVFLRKAAKHGTEVVDYLSLLAWNRCVMAVVGGPARTTIDTLLTRQLHGVHLAWVWVYTAVLSSCCVGVVRMAVQARVRMEAEASEVDEMAPGVLQSAVQGQGQTWPQPWQGAPTRPASAAAVGVALNQRFRASLYKRIASAFTFLTMWAWWGDTRLSQQNAKP